MKCQKVIINNFIEAWFENDYEKLSKEDFELVYTEYIDLSGLYQTKEFDLIAHINYLKNKIYVLKAVASSQEMFYKTFKIPYIEGLEFVKDKLGYTYEWTGNEKSFYSFLRKMENAARTKSAELRRKEFEFEEMRSQKMEGNVSKVQSRHEFIKMLNSFNKAGYKIDRDKTTIEELALIIKQTQDEISQQKAKSFK
jgi:hypothetical protein